MQVDYFDKDTNNLPLALTVEQVAQVLQLGKPRIYELVRSGKLRSLRIGRKIRVPKSALAELLDTSV